MKLSVAILLGISAGTLACSHEAPPQSAHNAVRLQLPRPSPLGPTTSPPTIAPDTVASPRDAEGTPSEPQLRPASGIGEPRALSPQLVPGDSAMNLAGTEQDHESIQEIREAIASDKSLSPAAKEVTIVARNGRVWLRGRVATAEERATLERAARQAAGVMEVHNELTVAE